MRNEVERYLPKSDGKFDKDMSFKPNTVRFLNCTNPSGSLQITRKYTSIKLIKSIKVTDSTIASFTVPEYRIATKVCHL